MIDKKNNFVMCHYFHDLEKFEKITGSISKIEFGKIVKKNLSKKLIYTFDDSLKSQFYIAKPILEKYNLRGIFFMNTFQLESKYNYHEISKFFCKFHYKDLNDYSINFLNFLSNKFYFNKKEIQKIKKKSPFYSEVEIKLRIVRAKNITLYNKILVSMFKSKKFNYKNFQKKIYMNKKEISSISKKHEIGLHTHSHFFNFDQLSKKKQYNEISKNKKILEKIIKKKITCLSYPVGKYNKNTKDILKKMNIFHAFKNDTKGEKSNLKIPRINLNKL